MVHKIKENDRTQCPACGRDVSSKWHYCPERGKLLPMEDAGTEAEGYQTTISLCSTSTGTLNAYFKLKAVPQVGSINLTKTTEDGKNLSGWQFGIYSNSGCTNLVSGPHITNASGKISVTDLPAGTYYVKELGHTDSTINAMYYCSSTNPQGVTVTVGATSTVSFTNKLNTGSVRLRKTTNTGADLSGWKIGLYELLKEYAFEGELPADDLQVSLQVVNAKGFSLPETGVSTGLVLRIMQLACAAACAALLLISYRKKQW